MLTHERHLRGRHEVSAVTISRHCHHALSYLWIVTNLTSYQVSQYFTEWGPSSTLQLGCRSLSWLCFFRPLGLSQPGTAVPYPSREVVLKLTCVMDST